MIRYFLILICIIFTASCANKHIFEEVKIYPSYPSASGIEQINNNYFIIGDDAKNILILDSRLNKLDSISLYPFSEQRIPKFLKSDLESISIVNNKNLLLLGSGSISPYRNIGWLINTKTKEKQFLHLDSFYLRLKQIGFNELNIEGSCTFEGSILLSNRGSKGNPKNHLILTEADFWEKQGEASISIINIDEDKDSTQFKGISGLCYSKKSDRLLLTFSTEDTQNNVDDGVIGKSYLWIINNFSSKKNLVTIKPNNIIDLESIDSQFKGQKIESVCISEETSRNLHLVLVADNDNGSSSVFKLSISID